jgi:hypothetical protein
VWQKPNTSQTTYGCQILAWQTVAGNQTGPTDVKIFGNGTVNLKRMMFHLLVD